MQHPAEPPAARPSRQQLLATWVELVLGPPAPARSGWQRRARCTQDALFQERDGAPSRTQVRDQRAVCASCPVIRDCLADALSTETTSNREGMRGGLTAKERERVFHQDLGTTSSDKDDTAPGSNTVSDKNGGAPKRIPQVSAPVAAARRGGRIGEQAQFVRTVQVLADQGATVAKAMAVTGYARLNPFSRRLWRASRTDLLRALRANESRKPADSAA